MGWSPSAVLFDLDHTLCVYERTGEAVFAAAVERTGIDPPFDAQDYYGRFEEYLEDAADVVELRRRCFADLAAEAGEDPALGRRLADAYEAERDPHAVEAIPDAPAVIEAFRERYPLGLVTNGTPDTQVPKLEATGLDGVFETVVFAGHDTATKPDPEPFERALASLGVGPDEAVYVGNSHESDVMGATNAGLRSVWIPYSAPSESVDPAPTWRVDRLSDLLDPPWETG